jgi:hypothetical protein
MVDYLGETSDEISYDICGTTLLAMDIAQICIHGPSEGCTVELKNRPPLDFSCTESPVSLTMLDMSAQGWLHSSYTITQQQDPYSIAASGGLTNFGFIKSDYLCLSDGCYDFAVATDGHLSNFKDQLWNVGGVRGPVPWTAEICVEKAYRYYFLN